MTTLVATTPVAWLIARAAGLVAFGFLTVSVWLGLLLSTRLLGARRAKSLVGWHQTLIWTAFALVVLHGLALLLDPVMRFGVAAIVVPGVAPWRPLSVAAGIVAGWTMLALAVSFHVRRRIGPTAWRRLHYAAFGAFALVLGHGLTVGTDLPGTRGLVVAAVAVGPVLWLIFVRILVGRLSPTVATTRSQPAGPRPAERPAVAA